MAKFYVRGEGKDGTSIIYFKVQKRTPKIRLRICTHIPVDYNKWTAANKSVAAWKKFAKSEEGKTIADKLELMEQAVSDLFAQRKLHGSDDKDIIDKAILGILNAEFARQKEEEKAKRAENARKKKADEAQQKKRILVFYQSDFCKESDTFDKINKEFADRFCAYLEQEVSKKDQTLKSVNSSLHAFQMFAKELCTLLGSTPLSVSSAIQVTNNSGLSGDPAKAAMSLFLGYVDAATNYIESSVGGGGVQGQLTDWSGRKLNESDEDFIHRCIDTVKSITAPKQVQVANVARNASYGRRR